jgi:hypothetical protein
MQVWVLITAVAGSARLAITRHLEVHKRKCGSNISQGGLTDLLACIGCACRQQQQLHRSASPSVQLLQLPLTKPCCGWQGAGLGLGLGLVTGLQTNLPSTGAALSLKPFLQNMRHLALWHLHARMAASARSALCYIHLRW